MSMVTSETIVEIQKLYERGVPVKILTQNYNISRQTISKYAKRFSWNHPRYKRVTQFEKIEKSTKRVLKERVDKELRLLKLHQQEFQIVRRLIQTAIDHENLKTASLAKQISETLLIVHDAELRHLSLFAGKTELKRQTPLHSPKRSTDPVVINIEASKIFRHSMSRIESPTITELFENWKQNRDNLSPSTSSHWRKAINTFIEFIGHSNARAVTRDDAVRWRDWLLTQNYARKTIESSYLGAPRAIFNDALSLGYIDYNPFQAMQLPKSKVVRKRSKAYSDDEARLILKASLKLKHGREKEHVFNLRKWGPWLSAFTGARINEICQLRKEDIQQKSGIWCIHITPDAGPVKSKLDRLIPLHPQLIAIGFIDFIRSHQEGYIFSHNPVVSGARDRSKIIGAWVRSLGILDQNMSPNHAWRHRFKTICRHAGIQTEYQNALTGHANDRNIGLAYGDYPLKALYREVCKLPSYTWR